MISNINGVNSAQQVYSVKSTENRPQEVPEKAVAKNVDEYIPSEEKEPIGLYAVSADDDGNKSVDFDPPEADAKTTTANTDIVDGEIRQLKEKQQELQRRLRTTDERTAADISRQLEQISNELALKDNDQYRRANTIFI